MFSATGKRLRSAAWRVSLWGTLWWAVGTLVVFLFLHHSVAEDTQERTDTWVAGEARTMRNVALRTPKDARYDMVVREIEESASREMPNAQYDGDQDADDAPLTKGQNDAVFFLETGRGGEPQLWAGPGDGGAYLQAIRSQNLEPSKPFSIRVSSVDVPYRVSAVDLPDGGHVFLGISMRGEYGALHEMLMRFLVLWAMNVLLGFGIIFLVTRRVLQNVRNITLAAERIGETDLRERVPVSKGNDEVTELASTLNRMLERIQRSVAQLQTVTGSLAHDLRSPLTAVRAKLEMSLVNPGEGEEVVSAIEEIDRLTEMLSQTLDVAEAEAGALHMSRTGVDLDGLVRRMAELYAPSMLDRGLRLQVHGSRPTFVWADEGLLHRVIANLFDNEMKHVRGGSQVCVCLGRRKGMAVLTLEDDGPGFAQELEGQVFKRGVKGEASRGHGLGLAFVEGVVAVHGGTAAATNRPAGGARLKLELPLWGESLSVPDADCTGHLCMCTAEQPQADAEPAAIGAQA